MNVLFSYTVDKKKVKYKFFTYCMHIYHWISTQFETIQIIAPQECENSWIILHSMRLFKFLLNRFCIKYRYKITLLINWLHLIITPNKLFAGFIVNWHTERADICIIHQASSYNIYFKSSDSNCKLYLYIRGINNY